jgi:hypothetical protein
MKAVIFVVLMLTFTGCTDATIAKFKAYGDSAVIECYSGEKLIYKGRSTGKVVNPEGSDGYQFMDAKTEELTEVSGNCIVTYKD